MPLAPVPANIQNECAVNAETTSWSPKSTILRLFGLDCCQVEQVKIVGQVNKSPANTATLHKDVNQELCLDVPNPFYNDLRCLL